MSRNFQAPQFNAQGVAGSQPPLPPPAPPMPPKQAPMMGSSPKPMPTAPAPMQAAPMRGVGFVRPGLQRR